MPSLPEAVETKYGDLGFDKQMADVSCVALALRQCGRYRPPSVLILAGCDIEEAGNDEDLNNQCEGVVELDLSKNKFKNWQEVFKILKHVPSLTFLNLSYNKFKSNVVNPEYGSLNRLCRLILNGMCLPWKDVHSLLSLAPSVEELHLCLNEYDSVQRGLSKYKNVKKIHFNGNPISDWKQIEHLGSQFPSLEILILADCPLLSLLHSSQCSETFPKLKYLSLNNSKISSWDSLDEINKFPELCDLRLYQCPLFEHFSDDERRKLSIARLAKVQRLNGGALVSEEERENAERAFIRYYMDSTEKPKRYSELVKVHGELDPLVNVSLRPQKTVDVDIRYGNLLLHKSFSVFMRVIELKKSLSAELHLPCSQMRLYYVDKGYGVSYAPDELKINGKQLYTLNIHSGDEFIVNSK